MIDNHCFTNHCDLSFCHVDNFFGDCCGSSGGTCGYDGRTTEVCDVSSTTLSLPFDIYGFSVALLEDAFNNSCKCYEIEELYEKINYLEKELECLKHSCCEEHKK